MRSFCTIVAAAGLAATASAQVVTNGDFETGILAPWTFTPDANGEPLMVATVAPFQASQMFRVNPGHDGSGGSAGGDLTQQITLSAGTVYTVSADLFIENIRTGNNSNGGTITVSINGDQVYTWTIGSIAPLTTIPGPFSVAYTATASGLQPLTLRFTRTFRNSTPSIYHWVDNFSITGGGGPAPCYANCDNSTAAPILNVQDFSCFLNAFAAGDSYANCDSSTSAPILNVQDFSCFLNAFAAGCS